MRTSTPEMRRNLLRLTVPLLVAALGLSPAPAQPASTVSEAEEKPLSAQSKEAKAIEQKESERPEVLPTAIFVRNRAGAALDTELAAFRDFLGSEMAGKTRLGILSREDAVDSLESSSMDRLLSENTSAVRLAQNLGARYLLVASLDSLGNETREISAFGLNETVSITRLRGSYRLLCGLNGKSCYGGTFVTSESRRTNENLRLVDADLQNTLLHNASRKMAKEAAKNLATITQCCQGDLPGRVAFQVTVGFREFEVPVTQSTEGEPATIQPSDYYLEPFGVTVALDGFAVGSASPTFEGQAVKGTHKLRLSRQGFEAWEQNIRLTDSGQTFTVNLGLSPEGKKRVRRWAQFLQDLKEQEEVTKAQTEVLEGLAKTLEQSGLRINIGTDDLLRIFGK